jgi:hypothetical protein
LHAVYIHTRTPSTIAASSQPGTAGWRRDRSSAL